MRGCLPLLGLTFGSWKSANCFRRNRFPADRAPLERGINATSRPMSRRSSAAVRMQCRRPVNKDSDAPMNAQDRAFYQSLLNDGLGSTVFCGPHLVLRLPRQRTSTVTGFGRTPRLTAERACGRLFTGVDFSRVNETVVTCILLKT